MNKKALKLYASVKFWEAYVEKRYSNFYLELFQKLSDFNSMLEPDVIHRIVRNQYLASHDIPVNIIPIEREFEAFGLLSTEYYNQDRMLWTELKLKLAHTVGYNFTKDDLTHVIKFQLWYIVDDVWDRNLRRDIYFLTNKLDQFKALKTEPISLQAWKCYLNGSGVICYLNEYSEDNNISKYKFRINKFMAYKEIVEFCVKENLIPKHNLRVKLELDKKSLCWLLGLGVKFTKKTIYDYVFHYGHVVSIGEIKQMAKVDFTDFLDHVRGCQPIFYDLTYKQIKYYLKFGVVPKNLHLRPGLTDDETVCYLKLFVQHKVILPVETLDQLIARGFKQSIIFFVRQYIPC